MPNYIVKVTPDKDEYVVWSDTADGPLASGTREEVTATMIRYGRGSEVLPARFERADETGSSAQWPSLANPVYGWDSGGFVAQQKWLRRENVGAYARAEEVDDKEAAAALLEDTED